MPIDYKELLNICLAIGAITAGLGYAYGQFRGGNRRANTEQIAQHNLEREDWKGQRSSLEEKLTKQDLLIQKLTADLQSTTSELNTLKSLVSLTTAPPAIVQLHAESTKQVLDCISKFEAISIENGHHMVGLLEQIATCLKEANKK